jgi:hypothetical protein
VTPPTTLPGANRGEAFQESSTPRSASRRRSTSSLAPSAMASATTSSSSSISISRVLSLSRSGSTRRVSRVRSLLTLSNKLCRSDIDALTMAAFPVHQRVRGRHHRRAKWMDRLADCANGHAISGHCDRRTSLVGAKRKSRTESPQLKSPVSGKRKFQGQRQSREIAAETLPAARRDFRHVSKPANCGHLSSV